MKPLLVAMLALPFALPAATTIDATDACAYGANIGWCDARGDASHGAVIGEFTCSGHLYSANVGWIHLGSGSPANGVRYQNNTTADYGVNTQDYSSDGTVAVARLRGYAYGANVGWIAFEATGDPRVDLTTGQLMGHAYGANVGWISLDGSGVTLRTTSIAAGVDSDADTIPDAWEFLHAGNLALMTLLTDSDGDGASDKDEYGADTSPFDPTDVLRITVLVPPRQLVAEGPFMTDLTWLSKPTRFYAIELNPDLVSAWTLQVDDILAGAGTTTTRSFTDSAPGTATFYRVSAKLPLAP